MMGDLLIFCTYSGSLNDHKLEEVDGLILLMEEVLHHLGCIKPCK